MTEQQTIIVKKEKSMAVAYLLLIFLGSLGFHRFYLGKTGSGIAMLLLSIIGAVTAIIVVGYFLLGIVGLWIFIDLFLTAGMVNKANLIE